MALGPPTPPPRSVEHSRSPLFPTSHSPAVFHAAQGRHTPRLAPGQRLPCAEPPGIGARGQLFSGGSRGVNGRWLATRYARLSGGTPERGPQQFGERGMRRRESRVVEAERHADSRQRWELGREADLRPCPSLSALLEDGERSMSYGVKSAYGAREGLAEAVAEEAEDR